MIPVRTLVTLRCLRSAWAVAFLALTTATLIEWGLIR
jgi:hypothetical protein